MRSRRVRMVLLSEEIVDRVGGFVLAMRSDLGSSRN
jgi:hypothetical protein